MVAEINQGKYYKIITIYSCQLLSSYVFLTINLRVPKWLNMQIGKIHDVQNCIGF